MYQMSLSIYITGKLYHGVSVCTRRKFSSFSEWIIIRTGGQSWYNITFTTLISVNLAQFEIFSAEVCNFWRGGIIHSYHCYLLLLQCEAQTC